MSEAKHAPGPWIAKQSIRRIDCPLWTVHADKSVASVYSSLSTATAQVASIAVRSYKHDECKANALLIAAAPELLDALEELANDCMQDHGVPCVPDKARVMNARAAIAKAKGGAA